MLKLGMKANQEKKTQDPEGWSEVVLLIRFLERYVRIFKDKLELMGTQKHDAARLITLSEHIEEVNIAVRAQGIGLRDVIQPDLGQRAFPMEQWSGLCSLSRDVLKLYQNNLKAGGAAPPGTRQELSTGFSMPIRAWESLWTTGRREPVGNPVVNSGNLEKMEVI